MGVTDWTLATKVLFYEEREQIAAEERGGGKSIK